jgi:hypothetical protein
LYAGFWLWALGLGSGWELEVGSWELTQIADHHTLAIDSVTKNA